MSKTAKTTGERPQPISCIQCGLLLCAEHPHEAFRLTPWGMDWEYLCLACHEEYVKHIMACLVNAVHHTEEVTNG